MKLPEIPVPIFRLAPLGSTWEGAVGEPLARWPIQGKHLMSELLDAGGWVDVADAMVGALLPDFLGLG